MIRVIEALAWARVPSLDEQVLSAIAGGRTAFATTVMVAITVLGNGLVLALVVVTAAWLSIRRARRATARYLCAVGVSAGAATFVLKNTFARARPAGEHLVAAGGYSFPSGHSLSSAAVYLALALVAVRCRPRWGFPIWTGSVLLVCLVGFSRAYLGVHYPSDVVAGWAFGAALAFGLSFLIRQSPGDRREITPAEPDHARDGRR